MFRRIARGELFTTGHAQANVTGSIVLCRSEVFTEQAFARDDDHLMGQIGTFFFREHSAHFLRADRQAGMENFKARRIASVTDNQGAGRIVQLGPRRV